MWGESPSDGAATTLRTHVAAVRRVLASAGAADALGTRAGGYLLTLDPADLDAEAFAGLVDRGQEALGSATPPTPPPCWATPSPSGAVTC